MDTHPHLTRAPRNRSSYLTRQRRLVLNILKEVPGHPDAGAIFQEAKKRDDRISLATVYRCLSFLKATGLVEENRLGEDHGHFEAAQKPHHYHFTCIGCGKIVEFEAAGIPELVQDLSRRENLQVTEAHFDLRGYCPDCQRFKPHS
jgi:Fe2+ or Zn2+ uptake regulation protein